MGLTFDDIQYRMAFMIKRQENKRVKNTLEKAQNYSRMRLTNDDKQYIMAIMTNNNNTTKDTKIMFHVLQTIVRNGQWQEDTIARFDNEADAIECRNRCHNGNPTTRIEFRI